MKIIFTGECSIPALRQSVYEQLNIMQNRFTVRHARSATLYLTPTNGFGDAVPCYDRHGIEVPMLRAEPPYRSAADQYGLDL